MSVSPDSDPAGSGWASSTGDGFAFKDTSPAGNKIITEIGFWQGSSSNPSRAYNVGIYEDDAGSPGNLIAAQSSGNSTVVSSAQWNKYTGLSIAIDPGTVYWIGLGIEGGVGANYFDIAFAAGEIYAYKDTADETLPDPFGADGTTAALFGVYAKYEDAPTTTTTTPAPTTTTTTTTPAPTTTTTTTVPTTTTTTPAPTTTTTTAAPTTTTTTTAAPTTTTTTTTAAPTTTTTTTAAPTTTTTAVPTTTTTPVPAVTTQLKVKGIEIAAVQSYVYIIGNVRVGTTQADAGATAGEIWADSAEEYSLKVGV